MDPSRIRLEDDRFGLIGASFRPGNRVAYLGRSGDDHAWSVGIYVSTEDDIQTVEIDDHGAKSSRMLTPGELFEGLELLAAPGAEAFLIVGTFTLMGMELTAAGAGTAHGFAEILRSAADDHSWRLPLHLIGHPRELQLSAQGRDILRQTASTLEIEGHAMTSLSAASRLELSEQSLDSIRRRIARRSLQAYRMHGRWYVVLDNLARSRASVDAVGSTESPVEEVSPEVEVVASPAAEIAAPPDETESADGATTPESMAAAEPVSAEQSSQPATGEVPTEDDLTVFAELETEEPAMPSEESAEPALSTEPSVEYAPAESTAQVENADEPVGTDEMAEPVAAEADEVAEPIAVSAAESESAAESANDELFGAIEPDADVVTASEVDAMTASVLESEAEVVAAPEVDAMTASVLEPDAEPALELEQADVYRAAATTASPTTLVGEFIASPSDVVDEAATMPELEPPIASSEAEPAEPVSATFGEMENLQDSSTAMESQADEEAAYEAEFASEEVVPEATTSVDEMASPAVSIDEITSAPESQPVAASEVETEAVGTDVRGEWREDSSEPSSVVEPEGEASALIESAAEGEAAIEAEPAAEEGEVESAESTESEAETVVEAEPVAESAAMLAEATSFTAEPVTDDVFAGLPDATDEQASGTVPAGEDASEDEPPAAASVTIEAEPGPEAGDNVSTYVADEEISATGEAGAPADAAAGPTTEVDETVEPEPALLIETVMPETIQSEEELLAAEIGEQATEPEAHALSLDAIATELAADVDAVADVPSAQSHVPLADGEAAAFTESADAGTVEQSDQLISESTAEPVAAAPDESEAAAAGVEPEDSAVETAESVERPDELIAETMVAPTPTVDMVDEGDDLVIEAAPVSAASESAVDDEVDTTDATGAELAEAGAADANAVAAVAPLLDSAATESAMEETSEPDGPDSEEVAADQFIAEPEQESTTPETDAEEVVDGAAAEAAGAAAGGQSATTFFADSKSNTGGNATHEAPQPTVAPTDLDLSMHLRGEVAFLRQQNREKDRQIGVWGEGAKWLQPFVDQIRSLEKQVERLGELQVQRENDRIADLISERDSLRERLATLESQINAAQTATAGTSPAINRRSWFQRLMGSE